MKGSSCNSIIVEGIDRLGKSTQTKLLVDFLKKKNFRVKFIKSPYNDGVSYPLIYWMLRSGYARKLPNVFQLIHFFNKMMFQWFVLPKLLGQNDFIVFDRWNISMWAYGLPDGANRWLTELLFNYIAEPDFTVILDGEPHAMTETGDSYEKDRKYQKEVKSLYLNWVVAHPCSVVQVDANQPVQDVFEDVLQYLYDHSSVMR